MQTRTQLLAVEVVVIEVGVVDSVIEVVEVVTVGEVGIVEEVEASQEGEVVQRLQNRPNTLWRHTDFLESSLLVDVCTC